MKIVGTVEVALPFALEYCAEGPEVPDLHGVVDGIEASIALPPSMGEKTDGRSFFASGWAWWSGSLLSLRLSRPATGADDDFDTIRAEFERAADELLRRFLNSYRAQFCKPAIYPVRVDTKLLVLEAVGDDDVVTSFPEPTKSFFYAGLPTDAPLSTSINRTTAGLIETDLNQPTQTVEALLALDAQWLESLGEHDRAARIRTLL